MFLHKFRIGDHSVYIVSESQKNPVTKTMVVTAKEWQGKSTAAGVNRTVEFLEGMPFSKEDKSEPEEKPMEEKGKKTKLAEAVVQELDAIADEVQGQDPVVAYLIDRVSDKLEVK